jgi:hypothetical protein
MADAVETETAPTPTPTPPPTPHPPSPTPGPVGVTDWRAALPEELREDGTLKNFKGEKWEDVGPALAKSLVETKKLVGGSLRIPGPDAKPGEVAAFRAKLGVPSTPDEYEIQRPELPEGFTWNETQEKQFKGIAHAIGLTPAQVQKIIEFEGQRQLALADTVTQVQAEARAKGEAELRKAWGPAQYDRNMALAKTALRRFGSEALVEHVETSGVGNHPEFIRFMTKIGEQLLEDGFVKGEVTDFTTKSEAKRKIDAIMNDMKGPYYTREHPEHNAAVQEVRDLYEILNAAV